MAPVADRPAVLFRWRRRPHRVARADGPERIAPEWWLEDADALVSGEPEARDYYRIDDEAGARFWVYREGLYRPYRSLRWDLHGFFSLPITPLNTLNCRSPVISVFYVVPRIPKNW